LRPFSSPIPTSSTAWSTCKKTPFFFEFSPYVCPEPVLVKSSFV
jgi:hypothetical protein